MLEKVRMFNAKRMPSLQNNVAPALTQTVTIHGHMEDAKDSKDLIEKAIGWPALSWEPTSNARLELLQVCVHQVDTITAGVNLTAFSVTQT